MAHIEEKRPVQHQGRVDLFFRLARQRFGSEDVFAPVGFQIRYRVDRLLFRTGDVTEILLAQIRRRAACRMARNVDVETQGQRVGRRGAERSEMGFPDERSAVSGPAQQFGQRSRAGGSGHARLRGDAVHAPGRPLQYGVFRVGAFVLAERPVGDAVGGRIHAGQQAHPRGGTDGGGVRVGEFDGAAGHPFHIGRAVGSVQRRGVFPERFRGVLPAHVVHQKKEDIGAFALPGSGRSCRTIFAGSGLGEECGGAESCQKQTMIHLRVFSRNPEQVTNFGLQSGYKNRAAAGRLRGIAYRPGQASG